MHNPFQIITIIGARPQFIKAAAVSRVLAKNPLLNEKILNTGQHYDHEMSSIFLEELGMPDIAFNLGIKGGTHGATTGRTLEKIEEILMAEKPDGLIVYGDTNATIAGALAAVKLHIPIFHIEAGLRAYDLTVPEDVNRIATDHFSAKCFAPSDEAMECLAQENLADRAIFSGDVMYDLAKYYQENLTSNESKYFGDKPFIFMTYHREENTRTPDSLQQVFSAISQMDLPVLFPIHPRTKNFIAKNDIEVPDNVKIIDPLGYFDTLREVSCSKLVLTDSGGLQKEAFFMGRRAIVMLEQKVWPELEDIGSNIHTATNKERILNAYKAIIDSPQAPTGEPYGKGNAAEIICSEIEKYLSKKAESRKAA